MMLKAISVMNLNEMVILLDVMEWYVIEEGKER